MNLYNPDPRYNLAPSADQAFTFTSSDRPPLAFRMPGHDFGPGGADLLAQLSRAYRGHGGPGPAIWDSPYGDPWMTANNPFGQPIQYAPTVGLRDELLRQILGPQGLNTDPNIQTQGGMPNAGRMTNISNSFANAPQRQPTFAGGPAQRGAQQESLGMLQGPAMRSLALQEPDRLLKLLSALGGVYDLGTNIYATQQTDEAARRAQIAHNKSQKEGLLSSIPIVGGLVGGLSSL